MSLPKVLVVHGLNENSRSTTVEYSLSFARYAKGCEIHYCNILGFSLSEMSEEKFDLMILTYEVLGMRSEPFWGVLVKRLRKIAANSKRKIIFSQDDYMYAGKIEDLINKLKINSVYTPIKNDLEKIYRKTYKNNNLNFYEALTGYVDSSIYSQKEPLKKPWVDREIDVGTRVRLLSSQFGSVAAKKGILAQEFKKVLELQNFKVDISTNTKDTLIGDEWYKFLGNIKFTIGRNGGASIVDYKGKISQTYKRYQVFHPEADLSSIEFLGKETNNIVGNFSAISPRLFEAAAMGVCQILEHDSYLDLLEPWVDYIPINSDLSNIEEILSTMRDTDKCLEIIENCYEKLIKSENFTYGVLVEGVIENERILSADQNKSIVIDRDHVFFKKFYLDLIETPQIVKLLVEKYIKKKPDKYRMNIKNMNEELTEKKLESLVSQTISNCTTPIETLIYPWVPANHFLNLETPHLIDVKKDKL